MAAIVDGAGYPTPGLKSLDPCGCRDARISCTGRLAATPDTGPSARAIRPSSQPAPTPLAHPPCW
jgi:hypothetical protein